MAALLIGVALSGPSQAQDVTNLFQNPGFETGQRTPWGSYGGGGATVTSTVVTDCVGANVPEGPIEGKYCLNVKVSGPGTNFWDGAVSPVLIAGQGMFQKGKKYTLSLFFKSKSGTATINLKPELAQDPWTGYGETQVTATEKWEEYHTTTPVFAADVNPAHVTFHVEFKAQEFWIDDVKWYEGDYVPTTVKSKRGAQQPTPDDKATDIPRDPTLSWKAGPFADTHNVYLGGAFDDVNTADLAQAAGKGQTATTFKPADLLEYGKTYYWRVDEVNAPPSTVVAKGDIWSFTVEPYAYPITGVTATASSFEKAANAPANTINGSGLTNDLHSNSSDTMWVSSMTGPQPTWIQYQFNKTYKLHELWVWNHNTDFEPVLGYGFKDVTIEYSTDGTNWTLLKDVQFAQAPAAGGYGHNTTVDLGGVMARYVRLTAKSNWSAVGLKQFGLSEVRFFYVPVEARAPQPAQYAEAVAVDSALDWRPGRDATSHQVVFGADKAAVADGTATSKTVTEHGFAPGALDFGTMYYWKVDEIGTATYPGSIWSFTTQPFAVVDDFETYTDIEGNRIYEAWIDGWTNGTGSVVGYLQAPFAEKVILHGGKQAMPLEYNNVKTPYYSETQRTFDTTQDWTVSGADTLALWYRGYPLGFADKGGNAFTLSSAGTDIWNNGDEFRFAYKTLSGNGSITAKVESLTRSDPWSKAGVMIRESLEPGSKHASCVVTPDNSCSQQYRSTTGGASGSTDWTGAAVTAPYWVRVTRTGNSFKMETSPDGKTWKALGNDQTIQMVANVYIGLAVTSHSTGAYSTAEFSNVTTTGTGAWKDLSIGVDQWSNGAAPLYVTVEDKAGKSKTVTSADAAATTASAWTEWRIPLSDLTGVNLAVVKKVTVGVGDKANPKAGAAGMLYIDDIQFGKPILPVGLVAAYSFEDDVKDGSGNGHDGTILGTPTFVDGPTGKGKGILFPGTAGSAVNLGTFNPSEKTGMLSVALWAKWNGLTTYWQGLIGKRDSWADGETMWQIEAAQTTGNLSFSRYNITAGTAPALKVGEWTHIAVTFDKTTARFYVNGAQTGAGAWSFGPDREASLQIGCDNSGGGNPFNGAIDEVKLYDTVLTGGEILALAGK
jgi:regulation of enolase protein 1 (concanavalin A-like superfamily)